MRLAGLLRLLLPLCRAVSGAAILLLFGHAAAFGQGAAAPSELPPLSVASAATAPVTLPKTIPFKQDSALASGEGGPSFAAIAVVLVLGLAGFALWVRRHHRPPPAGVENTSKRSGWWGGTSSRDVVLHGTTRLSPKHSVHDIEWRGRRLLIGCTDQTMTLLSEYGSAYSPADTIAQGRPAQTPQEHTS